MANLRFHGAKIYQFRAKNGGINAKKSRFFWFEIPQNRHFRFEIPHWGLWGGAPLNMYGNFQNVTLKPSPGGAEKLFFYECFHDF